MQSPLPERLQNLKISSNSQDNGREDANASSASEGEAAALTSKLQGLKGGLKGKSTVKQQKAQHKARKGYLIKGYAHISTLASVHATACQKIIHCVFKSSSLKDFVWSNAITVIFPSQGSLQNLARDVAMQGSKELLGSIRALSCI